jgi:four helix bundle protein
MDSRNNELFKRTKVFAVRIIKMYAALPKRVEAQIIGKQVLRSGTSVGAQYAEAQYAKSRADFLSKIHGSLQELEETRYWIDLLEEAGIVKHEKLALIYQEVTELIAIFVTIARKVKNPK